MAEATLVDGPHAGRRLDMPDEVDLFLFPMAPPWRYYGRVGKSRDFRLDRGVQSYPGGVQ